MLLSEKYSKKLLKYINNNISSFLIKIICCIDHVAKRVFIFKRRRWSNKKFDNILIIKLVGLGDTVLMLPSIKRLKESYPDAKISVLVTPSSSGIIIDQPFIDNVIVYDIFGKHSGVWGFVRIVRKLLQMSFDLVIDYEQHIKLVTIVSYFTGAGRIIGFNNPKKRRDYLLTDSVPLYGDKHMVESFDDLLLPLGFIEKTKKLERIWISNEDKEYVSYWLKEQGVIESDILIGIHPGSGESATSRRWSEERFGQVADKLIQEYNVKVVFTGSGRELDIIRNIVRFMKYSSIISVGHVSVKQLASLIELFAIYITNDTGPMHIGAAMGTPTIGLFGPQSPERYKPFGERNMAIYKKIHCSPCINVHHGQVSECKVPVCIESITVDDVLNAVKSKLLSTVNTGFEPVSRETEVQRSIKVVDV